MGLPVIYRKSSEASVSYSWYDIAGGIGIVDFYGLSTENGSASSYALTNNAVYSNSIWTSGAIYGNAQGNCLDLDFDLSQFNKSAVLQGVCTIVAPWCSRVYTSCIGSSALIFTLRKVKNGVETDIASGATRLIGQTAGAGGPASSYSICTIPIAVPKTAFSVGDILRINVLGYFLPTSNNPTNYVFLAHDPMSRVTPTSANIAVPEFTAANIATTTFKINVPFKIDV
jgi:hypothetical protein